MVRTALPLLLLAFSSHVHADVDVSPLGPECYREVNVPELRVEVIEKNVRDGERELWLLEIKEVRVNTGLDPNLDVGTIFRSLPFDGEAVYIIPGIGDEAIAWLYRGSAVDDFYYLSYAKILDDEGGFEGLHEDFTVELYDELQTLSYQECQQELSRRGISTTRSSSCNNSRSTVSFCLVLILLLAKRRHRHRYQHKLTPSPCSF